MTVVRIVRMQFAPKEVRKFLEIFSQHEHSIRSFEGCRYLDLLQDVDHGNVFVTISHWKDEASLEHYRNSSLFRNTWNKVKPLFEKKSQAFSLKK